MAELNIPTHRYYKTELNVRLRKIDKNKTYFLDGSPIIIITGAPVLYSSPSIQGGYYEGESLFCARGIWGGENPITYTYQWLRNGTPIGGATTATYVITAADVANAIGCEVTATNLSGVGVAYANPVRLVIAAVTNSVAPVISGTAEVGQTLSCTDGTWDGYPTPTLTFQWYRNGSAIFDATQNTYVLTDFDAEKSITCVVTGTNYHSSLSVSSNAIAITITAPVNDVAPALSGSAVVGNRVTCSTGDWSGAYIAYSYQWNVDGQDVDGQVFNYYDIIPVDDGKAIFCKVTASNPAGQVTANSNSLTIQSAPSVLVRPVISGVAEVGNVLSVSTGSWAGTPTITYTYQWKLDGSPIGGQTANTLTVDAGYAGSVITCEVTATNAAGAASSTTNGATAFIVPTIDPFTISGPDPWVGVTLSFSMPAFAGTPTPSIEIYWEADGSVIPGANGTSYVIETEVQGKDVNAVVAATNIGGTVEERSNTIEVYQLPFNTVQPSLSSVFITIGNRLTCNPGSWGGTYPQSTAYQWLRNGVDIAGETSRHYTTVADDANQQISCRVTVTNGGGSASAVSNVARPDYAPDSVSPPVLSGNVFPGSVITATTGEWIGSNLQFKYFWYRKNKVFFESVTPTYTLTSEDVGQEIRVKVSAANIYGAAISDYSNSIFPVNVTPVNTVPPVISGGTLVGSMLSVNDGTWTNATSFTYQWLRNGVAISGATANLYASRVEDIGATVTARVTAGTVSATSSNSIVVDPAVNTTPPSVSGDTIVGSTLTTTDGIWTGSGDKVYAWYRDAVLIPGATAATYVTVAADIGADISSSVSIGATLAASSNSITVTPSVNITPPTISGSAGYTSVLTTTNGVWQNPVLPYTYEWLKDGTPIPGATAKTYTTVLADAWSAIKSRVTTGGASEESSNSITVTTPAPINQVAPVISGVNTAIGELLSTTDGTWAFGDTITYQWTRDNVDIGGATSNTYTTVSADFETTIRCKVTNTNPAGPTTATSNGLQVTSVPVNTVAPVISGTPNVGQLLSTTNGTWLYGAGSYAYQWTRDDVNIAGAVNSTYTTVGADLNTTIKCKVTELNAHGTATAGSNGLAIVAAGRTFEGFHYNRTTTQVITVNSFPNVPYTLTKYIPNNTVFEKGGFTSIVGDKVTFNSGVESVPRYILAMGQAWADNVLGTESSLIMHSSTRHNHAHHYERQWNVGPLTKVYGVQEFDQCTNTNNILFTPHRGANGNHTLSVPTVPVGMAGLFFRASERGFYAQANSPVTSFVSNVWKEVAYSTEVVDPESAYNPANGQYIVPAAHNDRIGLFMSCGETNNTGGTKEGFGLYEDTLGFRWVTWHNRNSFKRSTFWPEPLTTGQVFTNRCHVDTNRSMQSSNRVHWGMFHVEKGVSCFGKIDTVTAVATGWDYDVKAASFDAGLDGGWTIDGSGHLVLPASAEGRMIMPFWCAYGPDNGPNTRVTGAQYWNGSAWSWIMYDQSGYAHKGLPGCAFPIEVPAGANAAGHKIRLCSYHQVGGGTYHSTLARFAVIDLGAPA